MKATSKTTSKKPTTKTNSKFFQSLKVEKTNLSKYYKSSTKGIKEFDICHTRYDNVFSLSYETRIFINEIEESKQEKCFDSQSYWGLHPLDCERLLISKGKEFTTAVVELYPFFNEIPSDGIIQAYQKDIFNVKELKNILKFVVRTTDSEVVEEIILSGLHPETDEQFKRCLKGIKRKKFFKSEKSILSLGWMRTKELIKVFGFKAVYHYSRQNFNEYSRNRDCPLHRLVSYVKYNDLNTDERSVKLHLLKFNRDLVTLNLSTVFTNVGYMHYSPIDNRHLVNGEYELIKTKTFKGMFLVNIENRFFVWKDTFQDHVEASTLKEAVYKFKKRQKLESLKMSLKDINELTSFCFSGTKAFTKDKMPHLYNLILSYNSWEELKTADKDLYNIDWELSNKSIFNGYPSPLK